MGETNDWANPMLKEYPFWRDGMTLEEYEGERNHYYEFVSKHKMSEYAPLWKQKQIDDER